jgi:hypothetical protein
MFVIVCFLSVIYCGGHGLFRRTVPFLGTGEPRSIPPAFGQEKQKIFVYKKQCVTGLASAGPASTLLGIVCFVGVKAKEKQQDGAAFQGMALVPAGPRIAWGGHRGG